MHNIHELEQRWVKYKVKFYLPYIITLFFSIVLIIALFFIVDSKKEEKNIVVTQEIKKEKQLAEVEETVQDVKDNVKEIKKAQVKKQEPTENIQLNEEIKEKRTNDKNIVLTPSLDFMKKLRTDSFNSYNSQDNEPYTQTSQNQYQNKQKEANEEEDIEVEEDVKKPTINISRKEERSDIRDVIRRFKKNNNPTLSLFVAKKYYKLGDYQKAYNYALITNEINNEIEQSWLIFAKSLVKLDKRDKAIQTLTKYVNHSGSGNAKVLLDDIKSGKFK
jgi:tetratricopeptide (TPR) repeat protein